MTNSRRSFLALLGSLVAAPLVAMGFKKRERFSISEHVKATSPRGSALLAKQREYNATLSAYQREFNRITRERMEKHARDLDKQMWGNTL